MVAQVVRGAEIKDGIDWFLVRVYLQDPYDFTAGGDGRGFVFHSSAVNGSIRRRKTKQEQDEEEQ